jgi:hypothetical protein
MTRVTNVCGAIALIACVVPAPMVEAGAPPGRYTTSNGTVTDTKTKLIWQQAPAPSTMTWENARSYCAGIGATLGGSGWRLPTVKELQTLVDTSRSRPAIDVTFFPNTALLGSWTSTPGTGLTDASYVWIIIFIEGNEAQSQLSSTLQVRCVR